MLLGFSSMGQRVYVKNRILNNNNLNWNRFSYGIQLGTNYFDHHQFTLKKDQRQKASHVSNGMGVNVGFIVKYRLTDFVQFSIEPSGLFGNSQDVTFTFMDDMGENSKALTFTPNIISIPLLVELGTYRLNNTRPFLAFGLSLNHPISKEYEAEFFQTKNLSFFNRKKFLLNYEVGLGVDFILYRFRVSPSIRWSVSSANIVKSVKPDEIFEVKTGRYSAFTINFGFFPF